MNDKTRKLLFDVLDSGRAIRHWRTGRTYEETESESRVGIRFLFARLRWGINGDKVSA